MAYAVVNDQQSQWSLPERGFVQRAFSSLKPGSLRGSVVSLAASAVGAGMLSLPKVFRDCGMIAGLLVLFIGVTATWWSLRLLVITGSRAMAKANEPGSMISASSITYPDLVRYTYGKGFSRFLDVTLFFYCFGTIIGFLGVISHSVPDVTSGFGLTRPDRALVLGIACVFIFAGSLKSELAALRYISILAVASMLFVAVAISAHFFGHGGPPSLLMWDIDWGKLPGNMTLVLFTFTCHTNLVSIYLELKDPVLDIFASSTSTDEPAAVVVAPADGSPSDYNSTRDGIQRRSILADHRRQANQERRMNKVVQRAMFLELGLYIYVACFGYATFGEVTDDSILTNYGDTDITMLIARMAVSVSLTLSAPLSLHPALSIIGRLELGSCWPTGLVRRALASAFMVGGAMLIALVLPQVSVVFSLVGATCTLIISQVIPCMLYIRWVQDDAPLTSDSSSLISPVSRHGTNGGENNNGEEPTPSISPPPPGPWCAHHIFAVVIAIIFTGISGASIVQTITSLV